MRAAPGINVEVRRDGTAVVFMPSGELDLFSVGRLREVMRGSSTDCTILVLDLRKVSFMDSSGVSLVVEEDRRARENGLELHLVPGPPAVQRLFELTGLARRLNFGGWGTGSGTDGAPPNV